MRMTKYQRSCIVEDEFLHFDNQLTTFSRVKFYAQFIGQSIKFRIAVAGAVLLLTGLEVHVHEYFRIASLQSQYVRNQQVIFAFTADTIKYVVVNVLQVNFNADFLSISLGSFCIQRQLSTAAVEYEVQLQVLAVFINIAVAVGIFPASFSKQLFSAFNIVLVFVVFVEFIITVVNRRRQVRTTGNEGVFQQNLVVGYTVQRTQQSFADFDIAQRFIRTYIQTSKYVTQGSDIGDVVFIFVFEQLQICLLYTSDAADEL